MEVVDVDEAGVGEVIVAIDANAVAAIEAPREMVVIAGDEAVAVGAVREVRTTVEPPRGA